MLHAGLDVHKRCTPICIQKEDRVLYERRILTERHRLIEEFGKRPKMRILLEAATESEWVARCVEELGHEAIVGDPNYGPMYAQRSRRVKTDKRDAHTLCSRRANWARIRSRTGARMPISGYARESQSETRSCSHGRSLSAWSGRCSSRSPFAFGGGCHALGDDTTASWAADEPQRERTMKSAKIGRRAVTGFRRAYSAPVSDQGAQ